MKFEISTQEFNYLVSKCLSVVSQKAVMPILSNLLIEAKDGILTITATDLKVGIRCFTEARIIEDGATTLPAKRLAQLIRELNSSNLEISTGPNEITDIKADASRFRLHGMSRIDYPALPDLEGATSFVIKQSDLKDALYRTSFAVSSDENHSVLTGLCLNIQNSRATFISTDGKRLARTFISLPLEGGFQGSYIVPLKAVEELQRNLTEDGEIKIYLMQDKIAFETNHVTIISKLLIGEYPDIGRVIPESLENVVKVHREELMTLLRPVSLFAGENNHVASFSFHDGELKLTAARNDIGDGKTSMPVNYSGPKLDIAFNPTYFLDILRHSKEETVMIGLSDTFNPGIIIDQTVSEFVTSNLSPLFVLMPMRLNEE